jgi:hypothetical protein
MLVQFNVVADNSAWLIDTVLMNYLRSDGQGEGAQIQERGKLIFVGMQGVVRIFALEGRSTSTEGPGAGLCSFGYALMDRDTTITFYIQANVPIKDLNSVRPVDVVRYELIPTGEPDAISQEPPQQEEPEISGSVPEATSEAESASSEAAI